MADDLKVRTEAPEAEPDFMIKFMVADSGNDAGYTLSDHSSYSSSVTPIFGAPNRPKIRIGSRMMLVMAPHS